MNGLETPITLDDLVKSIALLAEAQPRLLVGITGAPAAGKSTLAEALAKELGPQARVLPMDGFHLDNAVLRARGLLPRKGAPETFDAEGFVALLRRVSQESEVPFPTFDRAEDRTLADTGLINAQTRIVLVEGNYLLLQDPPWDALRELFDVTVLLRLPREVHMARLVQRWLDHGMTRAYAHARATANDMRNVDLVYERSRKADYVIDGKA